MLWSKPLILYDVVPAYHVQEGMSFWMRWKMSCIPYQAIMRNTNIAVIREPVHQAMPRCHPRVGEDDAACLFGMKNTTIAICWQHLFLYPHLKKMQTGWHLNLLPRQMVTVIRDGLYVCERQTAQDPQVIETTKNYAYRYGYEPDMDMQIHDFRDAAEVVEVPSHYQGFVFHLPHPWYTPWMNLGHTFIQLIKPQVLVILLATVMSLGLGTLYYGIQYSYTDTPRIQLLKQWPGLQANKVHIQAFLNLMGVFTEAKAPKNLFESIKITDSSYQVLCSEHFKPDKNLPIFQKFLKQYASTPIKVHTQFQKICLERITN